MPFRVDATRYKNVASTTKLREPKNFTGWSAGDGTLYQKDSEYTMPRGNVTFTAMWEDDVWDGTKTKKPDRDAEGY